MDEHGFKAQRTSDHPAYNPKMSYMRRRASLINSGTPTQMFSYDELLGSRDEVVLAGLQRRDVRAMFSPSFKDSKASPTGIVGTSAKASWHSPAPDRECTIDADLYFYRLCDRMDQFGMLDLLFLGMFFSGKRMAVMSSRQLGLGWYMGTARNSVSPCSNVASLARLT